MIIRFGCEFVVCTKSGRGFEFGVWYPCIGWNNGIHICKSDECGDVYDLLCHNYESEIWAADDDDSVGPCFKYPVRR